MTMWVIVIMNTEDAKVSPPRQPKKIIAVKPKKTFNNRIAVKVS